MRPGASQTPRSVVKRLEAALFSLLYAVTQGNHLSNTASVILLVTEDIQLLSFAFDPVYGYNGIPKWMPYLFNPLSYQPKTKNNFIALFYCGFAITVIAIGLLVLVCSKFQGGTMRNGVWALRLLRLVTKAVTTILFMPLVELYVAAFMCRGFNDTHVLYLLSDPLECISTLYLMIPAGVGLLYLAIQGPIITLVYFTINPSGHEADSKTTGRVDSIYTICRLALAITHELRVDDPTAVTVVLIMTSLIVTYLAIRYQPFFVGQMNDIRAGIFVAALTSAIQSAACKKAGGYDSVTGFVVLCASLLPAFVAGYFISKGYRKWAVDGVYRRLKDPKAAVTKTAALKTSAANVLGWKPTFKSAPFDDHTLHSGERNGSDDRVSRASNDEENPATAQDEGLDDAEVLADVDKIVNERPAEPVKIFLDEWHVELSCRYLQQNDSPKALHLGNKLFEEGVKQYPKSAHLILMKAYYIRDFGFQRLTNVEHDLRHVKSLKPAFDTRFFMFFEERTLEQELRQEDLLASHLNVTGFAEVLAMETSARKWHLATLLAWKAFWDYLKSDAASAECMPYLIEMAATNQEMAEKYYSRMVAKYPNSKQALRRYGAFLMTARVATFVFSTMFSTYR